MPNSVTLTGAKSIGTSESVGGVPISGTPTAGQVIVASSPTAASWGTPSFSSTGVPGWATSTSYVVDQRVISPGGRLAVCTVAHVSTTFFDAEKFLFPSDDGATVFDFTSLPNGDVTTITPTNGRLTVRSATGSNLQILNGVLVASGANFYFEAGLPNLSLKLRHFWIIMDIIDNPPATSVIILHWLRFTQVGNGINSAAHCGFDANENGTGIGKWYSEPYPLNLGPAVGPVWKPNWSVGGDTVRLDMIFNPETKSSADWYTGARVLE